MHKAGYQNKRHYIILHCCFNQINIFVNPAFFVFNNGGLFLLQDLLSQDRYITPWLYCTAPRQPTMYVHSRREACTCLYM